MTRWRRRQRGFIKPSRVRLTARLKRQYKLSYRRVQDVLTWIEMERMLASQRKQQCARRRARGPRSRAAAAGRRKFIVCLFWLGLSGRRPCVCVCCYSPPSPANERLLVCVDTLDIMLSAASALTSV